MLSINVRIKKLNPKAKVPQYFHAGDSGCDLFSVENALVNPREVRLIQTGIAIAIPVGYEAQIRPKSGLALAGLNVFNTPGTIDAGYRGEVGVILFNISDTPYEITEGKRIAQLVICPVVCASFKEIIDLDDTSRGSGGFSSTGLY